MINPQADMREPLIRIIQAMPENRLLAAKMLLEKFLTESKDSLLMALSLAPEDHEPLTLEEEKAIKEAREDIRAGREKNKFGGKICLPE